MLRFYHRWLTFTALRAVPLPPATEFHYAHHHRMAGPHVRTQRLTATTIRLVLLHARFTTAMPSPTCHHAVGWTAGRHLPRHRLPAGCVLHAGRVTGSDATQLPFGPDYPPLPLRSTRFAAVTKFLRPQLRPAARDTYLPSHPPTTRLPDGSHRTLLQAPFGNRTIPLLPYYRL